SGGSTTFTDTVSTDKSTNSNFVYSITTFFGNGSMSNGSQPAATDLPVIKNPNFAKGAFFVDLAGSFIAQKDAKLIINDSESDSFTLQLDDTGSRFTV